jgi:NTP pyrophosphatase (non-canonical NTP hydrolase)
MDLDTFADWADAIPLRPDLTRDAEKHLGYLGLGLAGEAGETVEVIKKHLRDGPIDMAALRHELGDVFFYLACICQHLDLDMGDIMAEARTRIDAKVAAANKN